MSYQVLYNTIKSTLLQHCSITNPRILDLGCGPGTEALKYQMHRPSIVVFMDHSSAKLQQLRRFCTEKKITYDYTTIQKDMIDPEAIIGVPIGAAKSVPRCILLKPSIGCFRIPNGEDNLAPLIGVFIRAF